MQYLEKKLAEGKLMKKAELVIVNDGSKDKTMDLIMEYTTKHQTDKNLIVRGVN